MKRTAPPARSRRKIEGDRVLARNRPLALERDGYRCRRCLTGFFLVIHHVLPRGRGGRHDLGNLLTLCSDCHRWVHGHPAEARKIGMLR